MTNIENFLDELKLINWFANSGIPNDKYRIVFSVFEAYDDWNGQMLKVWEPNISMLEDIASEKMGEVKIDEIFSAISFAIGDIVWKKWSEFIIRQHLEEETGLEYEILDMVKRDISWACVEGILNIHGFFTTLLDVYKEGYFPCAWEGTYPDGHAVVM
ncbi:MAG: hypothetical protein K2N51_07975 [Lachnospiraceae bacterium]|nr:hypothetical protein [Lachnospiraceae bacterium]